MANKHSKENHLPLGESGNQIKLQRNKSSRTTRMARTWNDWKHFSVFEQQSWKLPVGCQLSTIPLKMAWELECPASLNIHRFMPINLTLSYLGIFNALFLLSLSWMYMKSSLTRDRFLLLYYLQIKSVLPIICLWDRSQLLGPGQESR